VQRCVLWVSCKHAKSRKGSESARGMGSTAEDEMTAVSYDKLVIDPIVKAFPVDSVPPASTLLSCFRVEDQESIDTAEAFAGRTWDSMKAEELRYNYISLSCFSPRAIVYYLPGYMVADLKDKSALDVATTSIDYCLSEKITPTSADSIFALFTHEQLLAIKSYYVSRMLHEISFYGVSYLPRSSDRDVERAFVNVLKWIEFHRARGSMASS
jgi:hypothetical protein